MADADPQNDPWTRPKEAILEPDLPIVDPHHHLWDRQPAQVAALPPPRHGFDHLIRRVPRYLLHELLADTQGGHNVIATVFLECGAMYKKDGPEHLRPVGEVEFVNGVAAMTASGIYGDIRACAGIVGRANLSLGAMVRETLEAEMAASSRYRGIRDSASSDPDPAVLGPLAGRPAGLYRDAKFREGFAELGKLGLSFDAWMLEPQLPDLVDLARAFPETRIVLDHVGTPLGIGAYAGRREERFGVWRDNIKALGALPNVFVKLGGLAMVFPGFPSFMASPPFTSQQLAAEWKPTIETCIEAFGPERSMFESNFPVDIGACDYPTLWNAFKRITAGYSPADKAALYSGAATEFYRLQL
jgi:L-fuconolactonase